MIDELLQTLDFSQPIGDPVSQYLPEFKSPGVFVSADDEGNVVEGLSLSDVIRDLRGHQPSKLEGGHLLTMLEGIAAARERRAASFQGR